MDSSSMMQCPTVAIVSPDAPYGFIVINESDLKPSHTLWIEGMSDKLKVITDVLEAPSDVPEPENGMDVPSSGELAATRASLRVSRGARGKFYVKQGKENIHGPFETEERANMELDSLLDC